MYVWVLLDAKIFSERKKKHWKYLNKMFSSEKNMTEKNLSQPYVYHIYHNATNQAGKFNLHYAGFITNSLTQNIWPYLPSKFKISDLYDTKILYFWTNFDW